MNFKAVIKSVAHYVPEKVVTNNDLSKLMETTDEWITERTGIKERHFIEKPGISSSDLALKATAKCLSKIQWKAEDLDLIVVATLSPDFYFPGVGTILQHRLGCRNIPAIDIRQQCSGFVYGLDLIDSYIRLGKAKKALLVCAEVQSPVLDLTTRGRETAVLFGDGAGVLAIEGVPDSPDRGVIDSLLGSDGSGAETLCLRLPGTRNPGFINESDISESRIHPFMEGKVVFKQAITRMSEAAQVILTKNKFVPSDVKLLVPHQANLRINEVVREQLGIESDCAFNNIQRYGNTTAATIPICLSEASEQGKLKQGDLVLTLAFGAGFTWGANLLRW